MKHVNSFVLRVGLSFCGEALDYNREMIITNKDRYATTVSFLDENDVKQIGTVAGESIYLIGREAGSNAPVVCRTTDIALPVFAVPLYELLNHSQDQVVINEDV